ncbi:predicted protein [Plenodomus lingam JN3]|uniref:Predicted protein n=1 Tax=Leptosphaeria maculans (strain JN3 / isolate v23.1.3 / race Av1-4-5-6-7-8) TaxID=985895 RepID=E5A3A8_LEPMJ|nr:predicted protein [Plenodomus lingam JN3]CBX98121.1 predicted protein [Plenodomus lingam JN3]
MPSKYKAFQAWTHPFGSTYPPYRGPPAEHPQARSCLPATLVVSALTKLHAQGSSFVLDQLVPAGARRKSNNGRFDESIFTTQFYHHSSLWHRAVRATRLLRIVMIRETAQARPTHPRTGHEICPQWLRVVEHETPTLTFPDRHPG